MNVGSDPDVQIAKVAGLLRLTVVCFEVIMVWKVHIHPVRSAFLWELDPSRTTMVWDGTD